MSTPTFDPQRNPKAEAKAAKAYQKALRPWWKKKRFTIPLTVLALIVVMSAVGNKEPSDDSATASAIKNASPTAKPTPSAASTTDDPSSTPTPTTSLEDAKWEKYQQIRESKGLTGDSVIGNDQGDHNDVCQLAKDAVTHVVATKAVGYDAQAEARMDVMSYVKAFCPNQTAGWKSSFSKALPSREQANAIGSAEDYLNTTAFSKKGLIDQLDSDAGEGYPHDVAVYAVEHIKVNWKKQAAKSAEQYLESQHFSRQGLIEQLESEYGEQFTHEQAVYGVNHAGL